MTMKSKLKNFFALEEEYDYNEQDDMYEEEEIVPASRSKKHQVSNKQNVVNLQSVPKSISKMSLFEPRSYSEAQEIADHLRNKRSVVINLQRISHDQAVRIVDFLSGTVYAVGGDMQKIGMNIFLCTPDNVDVSGNISNYEGDTELEY
ncbi:cell division protein SepF [Bacillus suaedaesalsae]|uniref:Cell division protein SepF n=1 Tax=Bacillus suaedaesalsae TaxID=2810349 RepID=A0ABS2DJ55_9BACI|nr:cell division protein SepF [Bacillus suaedaesalsae]MBM6618532.1 cell division protein SepF [Bacillus suaedaesalsae]